MLPSVSPSTVIQRIADVAVSNRLVAIRGQQIFPIGIIVAIIDGIHHCAKGSRGIGILFAALNVTRIVVCPDPCLSGGLVIFPQKLPGAVVDLTGGR